MWSEFQHSSSFRQAILTLISVILCARGQDCAERTAKRADGGEYHAECYSERAERAAEHGKFPNDWEYGAAYTANAAHNA